MTGLLIVLALVVAVMAAFVSIYRRRVQRALQQAGHALPPELLQAAGATAKAAAAVRPAAIAAAPRAAVLPSLHFLLIYDVGADFIQRRAQHRDAHLALAWKAAGAGELLLAGALEEPTEQAFLLFRSREAASRFAQADPYVRHGLVKQWRVKQWHTVAGQGAATPVRPSAGAGAPP